MQLFARGLSTGDIEAAFTDADGRRLVSPRGPIPGGDHWLARAQPLGNEHPFGVVPTSEDPYQPRPPLRCSVSWYSWD